MDWMSNHEEMEGGFSNQDSCPCPDCESTNAQLLDSGSDDEGDWYEVWECECGTKFDHEGDYIFEGMSDWQERMHERRQMGFCNF